MSSPARSAPSPRPLLRRATWLGVVGLLLAGSAPAQQNRVRVDFWDMAWGGPEYIDAARGLVDQYNAANPGVQVVYRSVPWDNFYQTFLTAVGSNTAPCLSTGSGYQAAQLYDEGAILPIDDVIAELKRNGQAADFLPGTLDALRYDGRYVALPWALDVRVWLYRKDLFAQSGVRPPTTWAELAQAARTLTKGRTYGIVLTGETLGAQNLLALMINNGGGLFSKTRQLNFTNPRNVEALQYFAGLQKAGVLHPASSGYSPAQAFGAFAQGNAAIFLAGPGTADRVPELKPNIGVLPPPKGPHGTTGTIRWVNNLMMYKQCAQPAAAKRFLLWWSANQKPLWTKGASNQMPVRVSFTKDPYFAGDPIRSAILKNYLPIGRTTGYQADGFFPVLNEIEGEGVLQTLTQDLLQGKDFAATVQRADQRLKGIVK